MLTRLQIERLAIDEGERRSKTGQWVVAYRGAVPEEPLLVIGRPPIRDYYIVDFRRDNRTTGLILLNALSGKVGSIAGIQKPGDAMFRFVRPNEVTALFAKYGHDLASGDVGEPIDVKAIRLQSTLYWEPCDQSLTPFKPFYRVEHVKPGGSDDFFVRVDGEIHKAITHGGAGM